MKNDVEIIKTVLLVAKEDESNSHLDDTSFGYSLGYIAALEDLIIFLDNKNMNNMNHPEYFDGIKK